MPNPRQYAYDITLTPASGTASAAYQRWKRRQVAGTISGGGQMGTVADFRLETLNGTVTLCATWYTEYLATPSSDVAQGFPTIVLDDELIDLTFNARAETTLLPLLF
jgi:hypothetical protein